MHKFCVKIYPIHLHKQIIR